jgi:hypothetical protein
VWRERGCKEVEDAKEWMLRGRGCEEEAVKKRRCEGVEDAKE